MEQMLPNWLLKRAQVTPKRTALIFEDQIISFEELHNRVLNAAIGLRQLGIKKGDHVAVLYPNRLELVTVIHALMYVGAVAVFLNVRLTAHELAWQVLDSEAKACLYHSSMKDLVRGIESQYSKLAYEQDGDVTELKDHAGLVAVQCPSYPYETILEAAKASVLFTSELFEVAAFMNQYDLQVEYDLGDIQTIVYTSGTTGRPKGVQLSYGNHWWSAIGSVLNLGLQSDDVWLACVPLFHVSGLSILMRSVMYGMTVILHESFDAGQVNHAICSQGVTIVSVVTSTLTRMIDALQASGMQYPETFRCMLLGGGPAPLPVLECCRDLGIPVYQTYGMTETASQIVTLAPEYMLSKLGSAGKPLFQAQLEIHNNKLQAAPGEVGEIVLKGLNITRGYFKREEATADAMRDGWFHTGDLGYVDEGGFLYVVDRRSDLIISGGENIYPAEVESALLAHPAIAEAGVTGIPDERWGHVPVACVVIRDGMEVTEEDILAFCNERLARYKIPKRVYQVTELPRNASRKLLRRELSRLIPTDC